MEANKYLLLWEIIVKIAGIPEEIECPVIADN